MWPRQPCGVSPCGVVRARDGRHGARESERAREGRERERERERARERERERGSGRVNERVREDERLRRLGRLGSGRTLAREREEVGNGVSGGVGVAALELANAMLCD
eukprot:6211299-Pleurochrysis_carterae.AAC.1